MKRGRPAKVAAVTDSSIITENDFAQAYAMRVWSGQSIDVPRAERIERCMNALRVQNLSTDGIVFPT